MTDHPLHVHIGKLLSNYPFLSENGYVVKRDSACGEKQNISMFISDKSKNSTHFADADLIITQDRKVRVIIEIEESNINPNHIMGKFLGNALSPFYISKNENTVFEQSSCLFIQICDTKKLPDNSNKQGQFDQISSGISSLLPLKKFKIIEYRLIYGTQNEFTDETGSKGDLLKSTIKYFLMNNEVTD